MLIFNLKKQWYEKIRSGEKTIEYREVKPYWNKRIRNELAKYLMCSESYAFNECNRILHSYGKSIALYMKCRLVLGYTKIFMTARISLLEVVDGKDTDLAIDAPVYAIHLADVREVKDYD